MTNTAKVSDFWGNCWDMCGIITHILFSIALTSKKTFKTKRPRMAQITARFQRKFILHSQAWKVPFSHSTAQQVQKQNYVRYHFTEIRYEWQLPSLPKETLQQKCFLSVHRITETELQGIHARSSLFFINCIPWKKNPDWSSPSRTVAPFFSCSSPAPVWVSHLILT